MKRQPLKYRLNVIGAALVIFLCFRTYMPVIGMNLGLKSNFSLWIVWYMLTLISSCIMPVAFIEKMCDFHPSLFEKKRIDVTEAAIVFCSMLMLLMVAVVNGMLLLGLEKTGIAFPQQELMPTENFFELILYFVYIAVVPAVFEELFARGILLNMLLPYGKRFAVIASALIFMVMHTQIQSFIAVFCAGILLACIYLHTGNIFRSMLLHFINNAYSFVMLYTQQNMGGISSVGVSSYIISLLITAGIVSSLYLKKKKTNILSVLGKTDEKNAKLSVFIKSPVMVLALLCCFMAIGSQLFADLGL